MPLHALMLNCSLKTGDAPSSTQHLLDQVAAEFERRGVRCASVRLANLDLKPGVRADEGPGDDWPALRRKLLDAKILVLGSPIWLGQPTSIVKRVLERLDAMLGEKDDAGRMPTTGHVAAVAVVGNEDGAHHVAAELFQALNEVGFTIPASASTYWVGEAMGSVDYKDLGHTPETVARTTAMLVSNTVHLARLLEGRRYPGRD